MVACHTKEIEMIAFRLHLLASVVSVAAACAITSPALAATGAAQPSHDHGTAATSQLNLNQGRKWATDEPLRAGMGRIRALVDAQLPKAHQGQLTPAQYQALAEQVETEVGGIVANCKLEPKADATLHVMIGEIGAGTDAMAGKAAKVPPQQGLLQVASAVNNYGRYFDDPTFKPIRTGH
jgi:hypothetical protein